MCQRVTCKKCGKPTYRGCGNHIEQVLGDVPRAQRCSCDSSSSPNAASGTGLLGRLLGRRSNP